jgi:hypothetical protein
VRYVLGEPLLGDLLAEGLDKFGFSWADELPVSMQGGGVAF